MSKAIGKFESLSRSNEEVVGEMLTYYEQGMSDVEVATKLRISEKAFNILYDSDPIFAEYVDFGRQSAEAYWLGRARKGVDKGAKVDANMMKLVTTNMTRWRDKVERSDKDDYKHSKEDLIEMINAKLGNLGLGAGLTLNQEMKEVKALPTQGQTAENGQ